MGGTVNICFRFKDGKTVCQNRWTNPTVDWFSDPRIFTGDEFYVKSYLDAREDDPDFRSVSPEDYGLTVFDYKTNNMITMQDYSGYKELHYARCRLHKDDKDFVNSITGLIYQNRLTLSCRYKTKLPQHEAGVVIPDDFPSFYTMFETLYNKGESLKRYYYFEIDTNPLKYTRFEQEESDACRELLAQLGFDFDEESLKTWREWNIG